MTKFFSWLKSLFQKHAVPVDAPSLPAPKPIASQPPTPAVHVEPTGNDVGSDIIPFAVQSKRRMVTRGKYQGGWPRGAVVHYTAGGDTAGKAQDTIDGGIGDGYTYLCIDRNGQIVQAHPVSQWGYHAGESAWKGLIGGMNDDLIGIEICNPGILTEDIKTSVLKSWYGAIVPKSEARFVTQAKYGCPTGWYKCYSKEQEDALIKVLLWLKANDPTKRFSFDDVVGHHEISGPLGGFKAFRKSDPGGCLSMPMPDFRSYLKKLV